MLQASKLNSKAMVAILLLLEMSTTQDGWHVLIEN